ncbi:MAG: hypothetical protein HY898_05035 [Deltaproteobacteria bacterium]|nr:hypothetical protein [Deltaproteobacteria bacterium]
MVRNGFLRVAGFLGIVGFVACSAGGSDSSYVPSGGSGGAGGTELDANFFPDSTLLDGANGEASTPTAKAHLAGKVVAPEGTIPISGALVYVSAAPPKAIPEVTYCDKCVKLSSETPWTTTKADGSFDLPTWYTGEMYLIVQKGQFRRVRAITIPEEGVMDVPLEMTTLPGRMDKANGDDIPKMAIVPGAWDRIDVSLAKLGLAKITGSKPLTGPTVDYATAGFDYFEPTKPLDPNDPKQPNQLLKKPEVLGQYHIVFFPCDGNTGEQQWCSSSPATDNTIKDNLSTFVAAGGKMYVTDFSYEFVRQLFPEYVEWVGQTSTIGSGCQHGAYDAPAQVQDQGLQDWLTAQNISSWSVEANWTSISQVNTVDTTDMDGNPTKVTPKVWVIGQGPNTLSFERSCGRVLYSTYHTEADKGSTTELLTQEKALLYILLEVAVCVAPPDIK